MLWPTENRDEKFLVLLTDSAAYMLKAGEILKAFYTKMIHVTCLAHAIHRMAEHIRVTFPNIDVVISSIKKVFLKAPLRIAIFKEQLPNSPLPPKPILTRWGTWIQAAVYYADHLDQIRKVHLKFIFINISL